MILYRVMAGVIVVSSVKKETKCGWRVHNGGFINRSVLGRHACLSTSYYTTDRAQAIEWAKKMRLRMTDLSQCSHASECDLETWVENGCDEDFLPKSRIVY